MRFRQLYIAAAVLAGGLTTGCAGMRPLTTQPTDEREPVSESVPPGASKDSTISRQFDIGPDLGKIPNSTTDEQSTDSTDPVNTPGFSLVNERPQQIPLPVNPSLKLPTGPNSTHAVAQVPQSEGKIVPSRNEEPAVTPRPLIPTPMQMPPSDGKKPADLPRIINGSAGNPPGSTMRRAPEGSLFDPNCRTSPTAAGCLLNLGPNDSAVERAVELAKMLEIVDAENKNLQSRVRLLESTLETREKMLREDESELTKASQDLVQAKAELQRLREEFSKVKQKLKQVEKEDLETLRTIIFALEKILDASPP